MTNGRRRFSRALIFVLALAPPTGRVKADDATPTAITPGIIAGLSRVTQVALDPSGERLAYVRSVPGGASDDEKGGSEVWVVPSAGGEARQYSVRPESSNSVSWTPDGKQLLFASTRKAFHERRQVWSMPVDGGAARPLTSHETGVGAYSLSPDGKSLAFLSTDKESEEEKKAGEDGRDEIVVDTKFRFARPWIQDLAGGEAKAVYGGDLNAWDFVWTPDSAALIFQASDTPLVDASFMERRIYRVTAAGGKPLLVCKTPGKLGGMVVSPNGKWLAFAGASSRNDPLAQSVFLVLAEGGGARNLTPQVDWSAASLDWLDDDTLLVLARRSARTALVRHDVESGRSEMLFEGGPILGSFDARAGRVAFVGSTPEHPSEAFVGSPSGGELVRRTTGNPELAKVRLARQEIFEWEARDSTPINGVLTYPLDHEPGTRAPLVLQIHGGPEGVSEHGWSTRPGYPVQLLAAKGFMVLEPNYRGSGGHGVAFSKSDHDDLGGSEFTDVLDGIDALVVKGLVDGGRVGSGGWSYGGYFSAWAATRHSKRFRAAIVCAGISNWISFSGTTDIPHEMALVHWNSYWYHEPGLHWQRSPLAHLDRARTPTLIVHGQKDLRVPVGQSAELYTALKHKGVATELVLYPREPHGLNERQHQIDFMNRVVAWFEKYVK